MAELVDAMPILVGAGAEPTAINTSKPSLQDVLVKPVHEGGADQWTRFEGASAAIGYYIRLVHEGNLRALLGAGRLLRPSVIGRRAEYTPRVKGPAVGRAAAATIARSRLRRAA